MRTRVGIVALVVVASLLAPALAVGAGDYRIDATDAVEVPERTVTIEGDEFRVSSVTALERGERIEATVRPPSDDAEYSVLLYDSDRQIAASTRTMTGENTVEFTTDDRSPGSYLLGVDDGGFQAVHPVVIQGYDVTVDAPTNVDAGASIDVSVDLTPYEDNPPVEAVEVALVGDDVVDEATATESGSDTYTATLSAPDADGDYRLGAVVRGPDEVKGQDEKEVVAVSESLDVTVESSDGTNGGGESTGGTTDATATPTATDSNASTTTSTPTPTPEPTTVGTDSGDDDPLTPSSNGTAADPTENDGGGDEATEDGPGFGVAAALLSLVCAAGLARRRYR